MNRENLISKLICGFFSYYGFVSIVLGLLGGYEERNTPMYLRILDIFVAIFFLLLLFVLNKKEENTLLNAFFILLFIVIYIICLFIVNF